MCGGHDLSCLIDLLRRSHRRFRVRHRAWIVANESRVSFKGYSCQWELKSSCDFFLFFFFFFFLAQHRFHSWKIFRFFIFFRYYNYRFIIDFFLINFPSIVQLSDLSTNILSIQCHDLSIYYFDFKILSIIFLCVQWNFYNEIFKIRSIIWTLNPRQNINCINICNRVTFYI